ncbi:fimbrial protein [Lelliottia nimipressuralis]|uniref:Type 1 fimbrial protein n=1 Tax=Lelliottia nimipressuralis TaxID=69220 RepID=A0ABY3NXE9_9ENTR|nr:fimbrial protein [Lelliottia nimipressuralis]RXJ16398.1 type 1 fimbrial protein [Lelliottia nimipressuralis]TYT29599.1 type 1 fimbrial protein [Lelliottia nimipressuralis]
MGKFNSRTRLISGCMAAILLPSLPCIAGGDTSVAVNATVTASPCLLVAIPNVDLGSFTSSNFTTAGSSSPWVEFKVELEKCPATSTTVKLTLSGTADPVDPQYYKNTGSSTQVAIDVTSEAEGKALNPGATLSIGIDPLSHTASFPMKARMISPKGGATTGNVAAQMELSFIYG